MTQEQLLEGTIIAVDKPYQWTSFQVVNKIKSAIRQTFNIKKFKIGHAGTLDPLATGVLIICIGKATKLIEELQQGEKVYSGTMVFGATTPCYDLERAIDQYYPYQHITHTLLNERAQQFVGQIDQVPPVFSAVKIGGQRAYSYARQAKEGEEIPSPTPKKVIIEEFEITSFRPGRSIPENEQSTETPDHLSKVSAEENTLTTLSPTPLTHLYNNPLGTIPQHLPQADFRIRCGKGTYIRSLARDLGLALDSGAFLSALRREQVGKYTLKDAIQIEDIHTFLNQ